jgi:hypothetical protein
VVGYLIETSPKVAIASSTSKTLFHTTFMAMRLFELEFWQKLKNKIAVTFAGDPGWSLH